MDAREYHPPLIIPSPSLIRYKQTGDEASMSADGYITITGRIKDLIIRGGENIHPLEVENCLLAHPAVKEVSVVGVPDEKYGEVVGAFVVLSLGVDTTHKSHDEQQHLLKEDLRLWVREKLSSHLGEFSHQTYMCVII